MEISAISICKIDSTRVEHLDQSSYGDDFVNYLNGLVTQITTKSSGRTFHFERDTTEVRTQLSRLNDSSSFSNISSTIANRLLTIEQSTQARVSHLVQLQKGILVQALIKQNNETKFIICKADHNDFLTELNFTVARGLPLKKQVFKAFVCSCNDDSSVSNLLVFDTNPSLSQYWWKDFLELTKRFSDEDNTVRAFDAINKGVLTKLRKTAEQDYAHLKNSIVRYFRSQSEFILDQFLETAIGDYQPYSGTVDVADLKQKIRELPTKRNGAFDERFTIVKEKVKARFISTIPLTPQIDLHIKEDIDIHGVITAGVDSDGSKFVKIKSDTGYAYFNDLRNARR